MKEFGLQLYSIRDHFVDDESTKFAFSEMAKMGYTYAQTAGTYDYVSPHKFKEYAEQFGIDLFATHYDYDRMKNDVKGTVAYHKAIGAKFIGIGGAGVFGSEETLLRFIDEFNSLAGIYSEYGFKLTYHNHSYEFRKINGKMGFDYLIEGFDTKNVSFCIDTYWAQHGGVDVARLIERLSGRVDIIHLKDMAPCFKFNLENGRVLEAPHYVELGLGNMDFPYLVEVSEKAGAKYFTVEDEYYSTGRSMDSIRVSADYIKKNLL